MADYYPLIARAVAGLDSGSSSETRRALYERARTALVAQLRGVNPPLSEADITRERLALEEVIRKVEAEAAQRSRNETRRPDSSRPDPSRSDPRSDSSPRRYAPEPSRADPSRPDPSRDGRPSSNPFSNPSAANPSAPRRDGAREALRPEFLRPESLRFETPRPDVSRPAISRPDTSRPDASRPDVSRPGDVLRENARAARAPVASAPPLFKRDSVAAPQGRPQQRVMREPPPPMPAAPPRVPRYSDDDADDPRAQPRSESNSGLRGFRDVIADVDDLGRASAQAGRAARNSYSNAGATPMDLDRIESGMAPRGAPYNSAPYSYDESAEEAEHVRPQPQRRGHFQPRDDEPQDKGGFPLKSAIVIGVVLMAIGAAIWLGPRLYSMFRSKPNQTVETSKDAGTRPKIADRVGQPDLQVAPVAQRVVLYDEDPEAPQGKQYVGTVVWRTEPVKASNGQPPDIAVRADIEIPERKFKMTLSFRRNNDASLPASHTAELTFTMPNEPGSSGVANVPGVLMKSNEQARGTPLAGLAVKVTEGFFLVGLSNVEADKARNLQLLKERSWFDIPLVYANQRRAIIAIEKGSPGERAFNDAFAGWGQ